MDIKTWGEFEGAINETINSIVLNSGQTDYISTNNLTRSLYSTLKPAIIEYYNQMKTGKLGEPNEENLNKMMELFWRSLQKNYEIEKQKINKEGFFNLMNEKIREHQEKYADHRNTIDAIACFRFAADGRLDDGDYWALENMGNLATTAESLEIDLGLDTKNIRTTIMGELGRHANRHCGQPMDEENVTVYLCGGYGGGGNNDGLDIGHGQLLPEHMWIEVHRKGKPTISIDTFPSRKNAIIGARLNENFEGPPSEPNRIHTDEKTYKQKIPGLPLGVMQALAKEEYTIYNNKYMRTKDNPGGLFLKPDGTLLKNAEAVRSFELLTNPLSVLVQDCDAIKPERIAQSKTMRQAIECKNELLEELRKLEGQKNILVKVEDKIVLQQKIDEARIQIESTFALKEKEAFELLTKKCNAIKPEQIAKSKTMTEVKECKNDLLEELRKLEQFKNMLTKVEDKLALQQKIDEKRLEIGEIFTEKEKIGKTIEKVKTAAEKYLQWSSVNASGWRLTNWSYGSYGREQADKLLKMIAQDKPMVEILKATHEIVNTSGINANSFTRYLHDELHADTEKLVGKDSLSEKFTNYKEKLQEELGGVEKTEEEYNRIRIN
ncbi:hypothetical protein Lsan_0237 [Legionella santicrucis]|uniref:Uncharacterized protein n=1 Tax=Legionella santicrucis TaxID=45074 RepID=A0A0W0ZKS9_9GAMM|nr:hypothetical protein [Legionella santicrucis]KTD69789.1 hypothetical protein Lsan_0237 [Legionella santicrucis]